MTSTLRARLGRFALCFLAVLVPLVGMSATPAIADPGSNSANGQPVNLAYAVNQTDGSSVFELAFQIVHISGDTVDPTNAAIAYSSCTNCKTVAVAIQIVIYDSNPTTFTPGNAAVAVNSGCNTCVTIADAYQYVFAGGPDVHLSGEGRRALNALQKQLRELGDQVGTLPPAELQARIDAIAQQVLAVVTTELVARGEAHDEAHATTTTVVGSSGPSASSPSSPSTSTTAPTTSSTTAPTTTSSTTSTTA